MRMLEQQPAPSPIPLRRAPKAQYRRPLAVFLALLLLIGAWLWWRRQPLQTFTYPGEARGLTISPDGRTLAAIISSPNSNPRTQGVVLWETHRWRPIHTLPGNIYWLWFSPDSRDLITLADDDQTGSPKGAADSAALKRAHPRWSRQQIRARLIALDNFIILQRWDVSTGRPVFKAVLPSAVSTAISRDREWVVFEGGAQATTVRDTAGRRVQTLPDRPTVTWPAFSPDKSLLATGDVAHHAGQQGVWDLRTGTRIQTLDGRISDVEAVCFSPDGRLLATTTKHEMTLWDVCTWRPVRVLPVDYSKFVLVPRFSRDGRYLVSGGERQAAFGDQGQFDMDFWEVATGRRISRATNQYLLGLSPDGRFAVSQENDSGNGVSTSRQAVWRVATGRREAEHDDSGDWAFSPGERELLTVSVHSEPLPNPVPANYEPQMTSVFSLWRVPQP